MNKKFSRDERAAIDRLEKGIEFGTVLPVIGAGVSRQAANLPLLSTLLKQAIEWTHEQEDLQLSEERLRRLENVSIDAPTPECFQTWVRAVFCLRESDLHWETPAFREWLEATFDAPTVVDDRIYEALRAMNPRIVATTNFDKLLSDQVMPDDPRVTWGQDDKIRTLFREGRGVLHLHGICSHPESVVLAATDYTRVIENDMRSEVARMLASSAILLFVGVSPEGVTDRHLHELLRLGMSRNGNSQEPRPHVLLHSRALTAKQKATLADIGVAPVHFSDSHADLAPFLERLSRRRSDSRNAIEFVGLDTNAGETLSDSRWAPEQCLTRVQTSLRFMGLRSSKWVSDGTFEALDSRLRFLDAIGDDIVRFLILNPESEAYQRLERMRETDLPHDHLAALARLEKEHRSMVIKCVDFISAFRFTAVNGREIGLALYPTTPDEFKETNGGWSIRHTSILTDRPWSLGRSLVFMFDEHFRGASPLRKVMPELFS
jgi:SIR2-like domain